MELPPRLTCTRAAFSSSAPATPPAASWPRRPSTILAAVASRHSVPAAGRLAACAPDWPATHAPQAFLLLYANAVSGHDLVLAGGRMLTLRNRVQHAGLHTRGIGGPLLALVAVGEHNPPARLRRAARLRAADPGRERLRGGRQHGRASVRRGRDAAALPTAAPRDLPRRASPRSSIRRRAPVCCAPTSCSIWLTGAPASSSNFRSS